MGGADWGFFLDENVGGKSLNNSPSVGITPISSPMSSNLVSQTAVTSFHTLANTISS